ncbi:MAG: hypothetical protein U0531_03270 [Dehalococcoidia bacterium]
MVSGGGAGATFVLEHAQILPGPAPASRWSSLPAVLPNDEPALAAVLLDMLAAQGSRSSPAPPP